MKMTCANITGRLNPKLRCQVVVKEDDKIKCNKKACISTLTGIIYTGIHNYGDANSYWYIFEKYP